MAQSSQSSALLALAPEIRNNIYSVALTDGKAIDITKDRPSGLVETCRETRGDCSTVYYLVNTFEFTTTQSGSEGLKPIEQWLEHIGKTNCKALRRLHVKVGVADGIMLEDLTGKSAWTKLFECAHEPGCTKDLTVTASIAEVETLDPLGMLIITLLNLMMAQPKDDDDLPAFWRSRVQDSFRGYVQGVANLCLKPENASLADIARALHRQIAQVQIRGHIHVAAILDTTLHRRGRPVPRFDPLENRQQIADLQTQLTKELEKVDGRL